MCKEVLHSLIEFLTAPGLDLPGHANRAKGRRPSPEGLIVTLCVALFKTLEPVLTERETLADSRTPLPSGSWLAHRR